MMQSHSDAEAYNDLLSSLPGIIEQANHREMYGFQLDNPSKWTRAQPRILKMFLAENNYNLPATCQHLVTALKWRREFHALRAGALESHLDVYYGCMTVTKHQGSVYTWSQFARYSDPALRKEMFRGSKCMRYIRWRVGMLERSIALMDLESEEEPKPISHIYDFTDTPGFGVVGMGSESRKASKLVLNLIASYYPGITKHRYFINVPTLLSWVFVFLQLRLGRSASRNFIEVKSNDLANIVGDWVPPFYGGTGQPELQYGRTTDMDAAIECCYNRYIDSGLHITERSIDIPSYATSVCTMSPTASPNPKPKSLRMKASRRNSASSYASQSTLGSLGSVQSLWSAQSGPLFTPETPAVASENLNLHSNLSNNKSPDGKCMPALSRASSDQCVGQGVITPLSDNEASVQAAPHLSSKRPIDLLRTHSVQPQQQQQQQLQEEQEQQQWDIDPDTSARNFYETLNIHQNYQTESLEDQQLHSAVPSVFYTPNNPEPLYTADSEFYGGFGASIDGCKVQSSGTEYIDSEYHDALENLDSPYRISAMYN